MSEALAPGSVVGNKYRIARLLGVGGMGAVYEAENTLTGKRVALKWMHPQVASDPEAAQRFIREAQASSRIRHPNVVDVYDILHEGDAVFMVMELLEGESLGALLERRGASVPELIALLLGGMRGVAKAHKQGVVHRDIKPDNIFLARQEDAAAPVPKVLDFGISKITGAENLSLTRTGATIGTPLYMSLEQLTGQKDIDARTDIYAFGVILYEIATGQLPFQAETLTELAVKIATTEPPAPKALQPTVPSALERLILWAMAKQREERLPSLERFMQELEPFATEQGYQRAMTVHAAALPHAETVAAAPAPALVQEAPRPPTTRQSALSPAGDPVAVPGRRIPWRLGAVLAVVAALAGAVAAKLGGSDAKPEAETADKVTGAPEQGPSPGQPAVAAAAGAAEPEPAPPPAAAAGTAQVPGEAAASAETSPAAEAAAESADRSTGSAVSRRRPRARDTVAADRAPAAAPADSAASAVPVRTTAQVATQPAPAPAATAAQPPPASAPSAAKPAPAAAPKPAPTSGGWTPVPMPRRSFMGDIFGSDAQSARRQAMLQNGPPYRSIAAAKQAYTQKRIDAQTYEDTVWALKTWRAHAIATAKQEYKAGRIDRAEYQRRVDGIDAQYRGR